MSIRIALIIPILGIMQGWHSGIASASSVCQFSSMVQLENPLRIGAWNALRLGKSKMSKSFVVEAMIKVMLRYDIIVIQEIVDSKEEAPYQLLDKLNELAYATEAEFDPNDSLQKPIYDTYEIALSSRLGRKRYKEQYGYFYRKDRVNLNTTYQYSNPKDVFQVSPFVAVFGTPLAEIDRIALIPIHTSPGDAPEEIDALVDVYDAVVKKFDIEDAIILGDFNAGCTYVIGKDWPNIRLRTDDRFSWLISDHVDTTSKKTSCPYDRIVVAGPSLKEALYEESAKPFYFHEELNIQEEEMIHKISDHYPVEVLLRRHVISADTQKTKVEIGLSVDIKSSSAAVNALKEICVEVMFEKAEAEAASYRGFLNLMKKVFGTKQVEQVEQVEQVQQKVVIEEEDLRCGREPKVLRAEKRFFLVDFHSHTVSEAMELVDLLSSTHSCIFDNRISSIVKYKLSHSVLTDASVYGENFISTGVTTRLLCLEEQCWLTISVETSVA